MQSLDREIAIDAAANCAEATALADRKYDLIVLDLGLPDRSGLGALTAVQQAFPDTPVCVLSADENSATVQGALALGAMGYITKSSTSDVTGQAIELVLAGGKYLPEEALEDAENHGSVERLTPRQMDVLRRLAKGMPNKVIARELNISESTCKLHLSEIYRKLNVENRVKLLLYVLREGLRF